MRKLKLPGREPSRPRLEEQDIELISTLGVEKIKEQAERIVNKKLLKQPPNDGKQTPTAGNPVYKAMHACNVSSRQELSKTHRIPAGKKLKEKEVHAIVNLLTRWMVREHNFYLKEKEQRQESLDTF